MFGEVRSDCIPGRARCSSIGNFSLSHVFRLVSPFRVVRIKSTAGGPPSPLKSTQRSSDAYCVMAPGRKILIVDDDTQILSMLTKFLTSRGYDIHTEIDGWKAIDSITKVKPHLILLDIAMPGLDGLNALDLIRFLGPEKAPIPVFILSGLVQADFQKKASALGVKRFIAKPFNLDTLLGYIEQEFVSP